VVRGLEEPVEIYEAGIEGFSPLRPPSGSDRAKRLVRADEEEMLGWRPATGLTIPGRNNWVLSSRLGEGGFGEVWLAEHAKTHEKRVFKFCFQPDRVRALKHEVVLFRLLKESLGDREDITRILDWKFDQAPYFIESEFTSGGSLVEWSESQGGIGAVPLPTRLEFAAQIAEALAAAHSVGVLHKDLKPANILIQEGTSGRPSRAMLTDFGIGLVTDRTLLRQKGITATGLGLTQTMFGSSGSTGAGTRLYMAPEVIEGKPATIQSDIYSLGIVLYQLVTGNLGQSLAPGWERDVADPLLREDIAACVEGRPARRLTSASDLAERLRSLEARRAKLAEEQRTREEAALARRLAEEARRRRRQYFFASCIGAAITIAIAMFALQESRRAGAELELRQEAEAARAQEQEARLAAERSQALAEALREEAEYAQYVSNIQMALIRLGQGDHDLAREALAAAPADVRDWEWGYLVDQAWPADLEVRTGESAASLDPSLPTAVLWDGAVPRVTQILTGHEAFVVALDFSPDGKRIATGSGDRTTMVWDAETGEALHRLRGESTILAVRFSPDGALLATSELVQVVSVWDAETGEKRFNFTDNGEAIEGLAFSGDGRLLASHSLSGRIRVWDVQTGEELGTLKTDAVDRVPGLVVTDNAQVIAAHGDGLMRTWDVRTGDVVASSAVFGEPGFRIAAFEGAAELAVSRHSEGPVVVWTPTSGGELARFDAAPNTASTFRLTLSPDQTAAATLADDQVLRVWSLKSGELLTQIRDVQLPDLGRLRFSPDGSLLAVPDKTERVRLLTPDRGAVSPRDRWAAHEDWVYLLRYSPDGEELMTVSYDGTMKLWDADSGEERLTLRGHTAEPGFATYSPEGGRVLTGAWDGTLRIWDSGTGEAKLTKQIALPPVQFGGGPRGPVFSVFAANTPYRLFSPDGSRFIALTEHTRAVGVFDAATGEEQFRLEHPTATMIYPYIFSPDGRFLLTIAYPTGVGRIWDASDGKELHRLEGHRGILTHADFSPDGSRIATTSVDGTTRLWETATGRELFVLRGHRMYSNNAQFSPSGRMLVTSSHDQTARIWDVGTGEEIAVLIGHKRDVINAAFSPDESRVLTMGQDDTLKIWDLSGNELLTLACEATPYHVVWSPDGREIAAGLADGTVCFWRSARWPDLKELGDADEPLESLLVSWRSR
jgi:WD40 repeat protein